MSYPDALGPDMPHADLYVSKERALLIDGVLVTAGSLINGATITVYDAREHDELEFFRSRVRLHCEDAISLPFGCRCS